MDSGLEGTPQLSQLIDHSNPDVVMQEVLRIVGFRYDAAASGAIDHGYRLVRSLFEGAFPGYRACNTEYHNLGHTLDVLLATARLVDGHNLRGEAIAQDLAVAVHLAALLHDIGYIQEQDDLEGTGARYTRTHVERSIRLVSTRAGALQIPRDRVDAIGRLIACTDLEQPIAGIAFTDEVERFSGALLATADLIGQMADRAYLEKLLFLYYEFREAGFSEYRTEFDILRSTLGFYDAAKSRLDGPLLGIYREATLHFEKRFGIARNLYLEAIERQIAYLRGIIADDTTNFRRKLKRLDLESAGHGR